MEQGLGERTKSWARLGVEYVSDWRLGAGLERVEGLGMIDQCCPNIRLQSHEPLSSHATASGMMD